jgi:ketosteroid isomerase-like protein
MMRRFLVAALMFAGAAIPMSAQAAREDAAILAWLQSFDRAFMAKDLDALSSFYHPDLTIFEGGGANNGWADYRDHHIGPELKGFENLQLEHRNVAVHVLNAGAVAYVTSGYALKARIGGREIDSGGVETLGLVKDGAVWKIRHSHTSARRRPATAGQ